MKRLGILGGMGPAASAEFITRLTQQTPASTDQEHIPFVLLPQLLPISEDSRVTY